MNDSDDIVHHGGENVFFDVGFLEADVHFLKAQLVSRLAALLQEAGLTQKDAAQRMGVSQPDVSRLLRGQFRDISVDRIIRMMIRLGCTMDIVVRSPDGAMPHAPIHLTASRS